MKEGTLLIDFVEKPKYWLKQTILFDDWRQQVEFGGQGSLGSATYMKNLQMKSLIGIRVVGDVNISNSAKHFLIYSCRKLLKS